MSKIHNTVRAIFDSYLARRTKDWGQKEFDFKTLPAHAKQKVTAIQELSADIPKSDTSYEDWKDLVVKLADLVTNETAKKNETLDMPFGLGLVRKAAAVTGGLFLQQDAELAKAARAAMSAICFLNTSERFISELNDTRDELYTKKSELEGRYESAQKNKLTTKKALADIKKELDPVAARYDALVFAMNAKNSYHEEYFKSVIKKYDHRDLKETSFADFCTNASNSARKTNHLSKACNPTAANDAPDSAPAPSVARSPVTLHSVKPRRAKGSIAEDSARSHWANRY